jgi:transcriptional regulator with GAF, ATPase, and Fis domain
LTQTRSRAKSWTWSSRSPSRSDSRSENALAFGEIASLKDSLARENIYLEEEIRSVQHFGEIVGERRAMKRLLSQVAPSAASSASSMGHT